MQNARCVVFLEDIFMEYLKVNEILEATNGELIQGNIDADIWGISTDSRTIGKNMLFVPLIGEKFDGHDFIDRVLQSEAAGCITQKNVNLEANGKCVIKVDNTLTALQKTAAYYRSKFSVPFVAITGSVGKTSTKDMIAAVLTQKYNTLKTEGNYNNEIGVPLTVFRLNKAHEMAVTEMGMSGFGEIRRLVSIVKPRTAVITNIGLAHIEKLGSQENILKAKLEILEGLESEGTVILNGDDKLLFSLKGRLPFKVVYFSIKNKECDLVATDIKHVDQSGSSFCVNIGQNNYSINVPIIGEHNIYNALAAIAVGLEYDMDMEQIAAGIAQFKPSSMRMEIFKAGSITVINDCYNASPASMEAALKVLKHLEHNGRKIAVLGDMLELGEWAKGAHKFVGSIAVECGVQCLMAVGKHAKYIAEGALEKGLNEKDIFIFENNRQVIQCIENHIFPEDAVLVKGSRGMKMEEISEYLRGVRK